jgi:hypothetical protein
MRSEDVADLPAKGTHRILFLGDSVTSDGAGTDQDKTFPYLIAAKLGRTETLNPSCGGWAPANELGWLKSRGIFGSELVVLVINDGDLYQPMAPDLAGVHPNYPKENPKSGLGEGISRYVLPKIFHPDLSDPGTGQGDKTPAVADASRKCVTDEIDLARKDGAKVLVLFVPSKPGVGPDPLIAKAKGELQAAVKAKGAPFVPVHLQAGQYIDKFHPTAKGNEAITDQVWSIIRDALAKG